MATILLVDDDRAMCEKAARALRNAGHECMTEHTGESAMDALQANSVDLLVLDIMLPGISGFEVCRRVHSDTSIYALPILFLSAMDSDEEVSHGLDQGADDYLTKPFKPEVLVARVAALLQTSVQSRMIDELTSLPGPRYVKLEIQRALGTKHPFAAVYAELLNLGEFGRVTGNKIRGKAVRHFARALHLCGKDYGAANKFFRVGHMGGGHFVALLEPDEVQEYCERVASVWDTHLERFYKDVGHEALYNRDGGKTRLDVLFCVTTRDPATPVVSRQLFDILTNMRRSAIAKPGKRIHIDRRGGPS